MQGTPGAITNILLFFNTPLRREVGEEEESTSEATTTIHPDDIETGPSLGQILGVMTLVIIVFYIFGISWKVNGKLIYQAKCLYRSTFPLISGDQDLQGRKRASGASLP